MGAYSILETDQKILDEIKGSESVLIVGCARCANISIAHDKNKPVYHIKTDKKTGEKIYKAVAITEEAERLKNLLMKNGIKAEIETGRSLYCAPWSEQTELFELLGYPPVYSERNIDTVLVLTCNQGLTGMKRRVKNGVRVVWAMYSAGRSHDPILNYDPVSGYVTLNEAKSKF